MYRGERRNTGSPERRCGVRTKPVIREDRAGLSGVAGGP